LGAGTLSFGSNAVSLNSHTISAGSLTSTSNTLTLAGNFTDNGTFVHNSGTVTLSGAAQSISGSSGTTFNTLNLNGTGTKTFSSVLTINGNLSIGSGVVADLGGLTHSANTLTLGGTDSHWDLTEAMVRAQLL
jgi:hypothetical protein